MHDRVERGKHGFGEAHADDDGGQTYHDCFGEELVGKLVARRADRLAHPDFQGSRHGAAHGEVDEIDGSDQQHERGQPRQQIDMLDRANTKAGGSRYIRSQVSARKRLQLQSVTHGQGLQPRFHFGRLYALFELNKKPGHAPEVQRLSRYCGHEHV